MRALVFGLIAMLPVAGPAVAQSKAVTKSSAPTTETRYFTSIDGFMDGNADIILKETRQGKTVTGATLDVCYPAARGSERKDRFVMDLATSGPSFSGTAQSLVDKASISVKLTRKPTGETFEFRGQVAIGPNVVEVVSTDNSDLSEAEFKESQSTDDSIAADPKDFTEVSPESIAVRVRLDAATDFLKSLKGQNVQVALASLAVTCEALRAGEQLISLSIDPERAAAFVEKIKAAPGVVAAGWTSGTFDMDRTIRFAAADWRDGERLNRDKLAAAVGAVLARATSAQQVAAKWSDETGKLTLTFKRPNELIPALNLTDTIEFTALAAPEKPDGSDRMLLWISNPLISTADEGSGSRLSLSDAGGSEEEIYRKDESGALDAVAREFRGQRWNPDKATWR
jgi:hypothetical protein